MIKFMDEIVEEVERFAREYTASAIAILGFLEKILIVITTPVWILPYKVIRAKIGEYVANERQGKEDAGKND